MTQKSKISTESYKGVRDFYPEDMFVQNYIFKTWREVVESFGYNEYNASILEPAELYRAKSGEEIVNEQTYTFKDRGDREVTLRPEMTPSVARMVAARQSDLSFPLRWFSIPNLFRYEKPQRGRLREHWQLNVDMFGVDTLDADVETISIASQIIKKFGATDSDFVIKINSRKLLNDLYSHFSLNEEQSQKISKVIDKKNKISEDIFESSLKEIIGDKTSDLIRVISSPERFMDIIGKGAGANTYASDTPRAENNKNADEFVAFIEKLQNSGIKNAIFDPTLMRGFDYYTGIVFEIFDTHPENNRAVFGGGRYDDLLDIFDSRKIPAVGFGVGDVTIKDFLEVHNLLPKFSPSADLYIAVMNQDYITNANSIAEKLRFEGINVSVDLTSKKIGDQIKTADKQKIPYIIVIGENEIKNDIYSLKHMETGTENKVSISGIVEVIKKSK